MTSATAVDNTPTLIVLERLVGEVGGLLDGVDAAAWAASTPCAEFDVHRSGPVAVVTGRAAHGSVPADRTPRNPGPR